MKKIQYKKPEIEIINLDNEISLQLQSLPPTPEGETSLYFLEQNNQDVYNHA